jgi:NADH-quinone oxidoreductase subunit N
MNTLIAISALGVFCLIAEIFNLRKTLVPITILGLLGILASTLHFYSIGELGSDYSKMIVADKYADAFSSLFIILTIFLVTMSYDVYKEHQTKISDYVAIKVFLLAGAVAMVSFTNLSMYFLGIETLSIALYILAGSSRLNIKSNEAGMKYFLMGSFASGFILFGICLIYGTFGTFDMNQISEFSGAADKAIWFSIGVSLITIGMLFKIAAVPFHFWAPDVYEGAPSLVTATMSTLAKVVAFATLYKLLAAMNLFPSLQFQNSIVVISILSMTVGNIMALRQENVKRMLAFSGISHAGFMLMTVLSIENSSSNLLYYASAYALAGAAAFAVIIAVTKDKNNEDVLNFNGLGKTNPLLAAILTASLLSMAGIPIFAGFFAKFNLFTQTIQAGYLVVVIAGVVNSIISVGYYFKLVLAMYTKEAVEGKKHTPLVYYVVGIIAIGLNIAIGIYPTVLSNLLK